MVSVPKFRIYGFVFLISDFGVSVFSQFRGPWGAVFPHLRSRSPPRSVVSFPGTVNLLLPISGGSIHSSSCSLVVGPWAYTRTREALLKRGLTKARSKLFSFHFSLSLFLSPFYTVCGCVLFLAYHCVVRFISFLVPVLFCRLSTSTNWSTGNLLKSFLLACRSTYAHLWALVECKRMYIFPHLLSRMCVHFPVSIPRRSSDQDRNN